MDAAAGEDAVAAFECGGEFLGVEALEAEADDADTAGRVARAVARQAWDALDPLQEHLRQGSLVG